ncbi:MAG: hypothetical protein V1695_02770 [Candidatus Uhrbacteria bacterium]
MAVKIIKSENGVSRKISDSYSVLNLLTADDSDNVSLAVGSARDHKETTNTTSDRVYYVLGGEMVVNDQLAKKGDVVFVPANTEYNFKGSFETVLVNAPPFKSGNESKVE